MEARVKQVVENEPVEVRKIENTTSKIFLPDVSHLDDKEIERLIEESDQRIVDIWVDAYLNGRYDAEMLEKFGPYEMINIYE
ncbi:hypothetical protein [Tissierella praeacuta]|uniref:hypothetical protein n=1 Tax=Tissierella praeacuta TaxID=43131 RepID=UPI0033412EB0